VKVPLSARILQKRPKIDPKSEISWKIGSRCFPNWAQKFQNGRRPPLGASHVCFRAPQGDYKHAAWPTRGTHLSHLAPFCLPLGPQHSRFVTRDVPKPPKDIFASHIFPSFFQPTRNPLKDILGIRPSSKSSTYRTTSPTQLHGASACTQNTRHPQTNIYELSQSIFTTLLPASKDATSPGFSLHRLMITSRLRPRRTQGILARPLTTHTHRNVSNPYAFLTLALQNISSSLSSIAPLQDFAPARYVCKHSLHGASVEAPCLFTPTANAPEPNVFCKCHLRDFRVSPLGHVLSRPCNRTMRARSATHFRKLCNKIGFLCSLLLRRPAHHTTFLFTLLHLAPS
jgi:hypothetical protein